MVTKYMCELLKVSEPANLSKKFQKFVKLCSYKGFFLNVNRKDVFIWVGLESR